MQIYNYDKDGFYTGEGYANPNPRVKGEYLIPANATIIEVPTLKENQKTRFNKIKNKWEIYTITAISKDTVIDEELKEIRDMNLEEKIDKGIITLSEYQKLNDDKTEIIDKNYAELIADNILTLDEVKKEKLLKELSLKVNQIRERGLKFTINGKECYHKCRDEDNTAILSIISDMETTGSPTKPNYRMFQENYMSCWVEPTLAKLKEIQSKCFSYISNNIYAEIRRIETEISNLTELNIDNYEVMINETI